MDPNDFYDSLKSDRDRDEEWTASAEHFVRLKRQAGAYPVEEEPLEKEASMRPTAPSLADKLREKLHGKAKIAGPLQTLKNTDPVLMGTVGLGALAGGVGTYLSSRPRKGEDKSRAEVDLDRMIRGRDGGPEKGLTDSMKNRTTELSRGYAEAFRKHPVKAGLLGAALGGSGGYTLGKLLGAGGKVS